MDLRVHNSHHAQRINAGIFVEAASADVNSFLGLFPLSVDRGSPYFCFGFYTFPWIRVHLPHLAFTLNDRSVPFIERRQPRRVTVNLFQLY